MSKENRLSQFNKEIVFSVSEYNEYVNEIVSVDIVVVEGEVSNFRPISGRNFLYFDIKDEKTVAKCFQGFWRSEKVELQNGSLVKIVGYPTMQKNGSFVIDVREILLVGEGELMQRYLKLKEKLEKEGLFEERFKQELPVFPRKVGLIAGKNSSAYHDVVAEITERWQGAEIIFYPSRVQGIHAKKEVIKAIRTFNKRTPVDTIIVARGGGSLEDLQAFDSEEVVREIFASSIPLISAIGHEDHWTLSDFVADVRAKTPTKAAQIAVPQLSEIKQRIGYFLDRMRIIIFGRIETSRMTLDHLTDNLKKIQTQIFQGINITLDGFVENMQNATLSGVQRNGERLENLWKNLQLLDPRNVLARGFAVVEKGGKRMESVDCLENNDIVKTTLRDGQFESTIIRKYKSKE